MARTKTPGGIVTRHTRKCATRSGGKRCDCTPSYEAWISFRGTRSRKNFGPDLAAAKGWLVDANKAARAGTLRKPSVLTLEAAGERFVAGMKTGEIHSRGRKPYKPSNIRSYEASLRLHVYPELGRYRLAELALPDLQGWVNQMIAKKANPSTIRNAVNPVRAIYSHYRSIGEVAINPTSGLKLPAVDGQRTRVADPVEAEELLAALPESDQPIWATAFYGGLRLGELRGLRCNEVDTKNGLIHVNRGWDHIEGPIDPKSIKGKRKVPIPAVLSKRLSEWMLSTGRRGDDLIFGRSTADPFTPSFVYKKARKAWKEENERRVASGTKPPLKPILLHECRHTYVSLMHAAGNNLETIGDFVGHSSSYMTDKYRHLLPTSHDEARRKLDSLLAGRL